MYLLEENSYADGGILLVFSDYANWRKHIPAAIEGTVYRILLETVVLGIQEDLEICLHCCEKQWYFNNQRIVRGIPFSQVMAGNEKLLFVLCEEGKDIAPMGRIQMQDGENIKIGKAFPNAILYDFDSRVEACHVCIKLEEQVCRMETNGLSGIYVNGKAAQGVHTLRNGDRIDIYGLHLLIAQNWIICSAFCGICRVAEKKETFRFQVNSEVTVFSKNRNWMERKYEEEGVLHTQEFEILLPTPPAKRLRNQLLLTLGPSMTMVLPTMLMAIAGSSLMGNNGGNFYYLTVLMTGCCSLLSVFWGLINHLYKKHTWKEDEKNRCRQYREYLEQVQKQLEGCRRENLRVMVQRYPPCSATIYGQEDNLIVMWNRYYMNKDFLFLRIGTGTVPFQMHLKLNERQKQIVSEKLVEEAKAVVERFSFINQSPLGIDFYATRRLGIISKIGADKIYECLKLLLAQIAICHCYNEVKVGCFYNPSRYEERAFANCVRWMSHSWSEDKEVRFLAGNEQEAAEIIPVLTGELEAKIEKSEEQKKLPWFILFVLDKSLIQGEPLYQYLTEPTGKYAVSTIFIGESKEQLPTSCRCYIRYLQDRQEIVTYGQEQVCRQQVNVDTVEGQAVELYLRRLSGLRVKEALPNRIPKQVTFLELYECKRVEEINSKCRWARSKPGDRLKVPIGRGRGGAIISLDVHEKFHGPHGLIAGTTGSGKSELIQTYLMSIAVSYSPRDVIFFMIDYKGGGTGNILMSLPHCAGVISNLSGSQIKRAMSAISSENKRRQKLLSEYRVNHIDSYTELFRAGKAEEPMPHLILVVDEFAELKKEEPEFMQEIISLAQVGRSLGVHLVLATQKPAGTVDDKIWSNARFRLCLRVQDRQDSMDMLHCADAARLTSPGQCYLQIGNNEYFELFQTAYCGGIYHCREEASAKTILVSDTGKRTSYKENADGEPGTEQMKVLLDYVCRTAKENNYEPVKPLWMPELPAYLSLDVLEEGQKEELNADQGIRVTLGMVDDPENQKQFRLAYLPFLHGHLAVYGGPSTGKSTLLQTVLWQICNEFQIQQVQFLLVDIGRGSLRCFANMPHCISYFSCMEDRDIFFYHLKRLIGRRKELLSGIGYQQYNNQAKEKLPLLLFIIDGAGSLLQLVSEQQLAFLHKIISEGVNYGVFLIMTATGTGEIPGRMLEKMKTTIALELSDRFQYGEVLRQYPISVYPKENTRGRGLCKVERRILELQVALLSNLSEDFSRIQLIKELEQKLIYKQKGRETIIKFPQIPKQMSMETLFEEFQWNPKVVQIPIGYSLATGEIRALSIARGNCFLISGAENTGRKNLLYLLAEGMVRQKQKIVCLDIRKELSMLSGRENITLLSGEKEISQWQKEQNETACYEEVCFFIGDMTDFCTYLYTGGESQRSTFWENCIRGRKKINTLVAIYNSEQDKLACATAFFKEFIFRQSGVHLGGNAGAQRAFSFDDLSYSQLNQKEKVGIAYFKRNRNAETDRLIVPPYSISKNERKEANDIGRYTGDDFG